MIFKRFIKYTYLVILFLGFSKISYAQCAGSNGTVTVCNKDTDSNNQTFNLNIHLNGSPTSGGMWSTDDPNNFAALDRATGIVNLWAITNFGEHIFTYTNDSCNDSATVTIYLGGYPGENNTDGSANACSSNPFVNLHTYIGSSVDGKAQDFNGLWTEDPTTETGFIIGSTFNAEEAGPGEYIFYYTVGAVLSDNPTLSCTERVATLFLEVHRDPEPGEPIDFSVCTTDDLSAFTNFELFSLLTGEDTGGTWSENRTNQLLDLTDSTINIEEINTNFGYGRYPFTYSVFPRHPICPIRESTVNINILPVLMGSMSAENFCAGIPSTVNISYDDTLLPNGNYEISYIINTSSGTLST